MASNIAHKVGLDMNQDIRENYPNFSRTDYLKELAKGMVIGMLPWKVQEQIAEKTHGEEKIMPYYVATVNSRASRAVQATMGVAYLVSQAFGADLPGMIDFIGVYSAIDSTLRETQVELFRRALPFQPGENNPSNPRRRTAVGTTPLEVLYWGNKLVEGTKEETVGVKENNS